MPREKRRRSRAIIDFEITILYLQKEIKVKTMNVSLTGISCTGSPLFCAGGECMVNLKLNQEASLNIQGKIIRADNKEATISFISMDEDTFYHLKRLLQYNAADPDAIDNELIKPAFRHNG